MYVYISYVDEVINMRIEKKIIPTYEDYIAYSDGRVYSNKSNKFLTPVALNRGYLGIILYNSNGRKMISRHRLICSIFNPVPNMRDLTVDHINGIPGSDNSKNLEFVTIKENIQRFYRANGKRKMSPGLWCGSLTLILRLTIRILLIAVKR